MGKSAKKKRQKERQRLERLNQLSTFGALNLSSKTGPATTGSTDAGITAHNANSSREENISSSVARSNSIPSSSSLVPTSRNASPNPPESFKTDTFGSSSNRVRTLPVVAFVFPRNESAGKKRQEPKPYEFGSVDENRADLDHNGSTDAQRTNHVVSKSKESIDEILYQKVNQAKEPSSVANKTSHDSHVTSRTIEAETPQHEPLQRRMESTPTMPYFSGISVEEAVRDKVGLRPRANSTDGELKLPQRGLCDERKVLECYKWRSGIGGSNCNTAPKGFHNLGNTCFLNSTLQCLAYCPPFCQLLIAIPRVDDAPKNSLGHKINQGKVFTHMMASLFRRVHNPDNTKGALSPRKIVSALPLLGSGSTRRNGYKFRPGRQEDAHEFLVHLLDAMNDGELRDAGINANKSGWRDRLPVPRLDETTFVHRIFGGYLRSQVRCTDCGYRSNTYDPFLDLSLEISRNSCHSLSSAFNEFTRKETLDSQNRWKCSGCKKRVCATKQLTVFRPPLALCVQLKRFKFGGSQYGGKISKAIEFPAQLQLPLSDGRSCGYVLTGIVIHIGSGASSGHYTACVQRPSSNGDRKWFHMNDSFVQPVSEQQVLRQQNAYVLMYCRHEVKIEFPTPPLRSSMTTDEAKELAQSRQKAKSGRTTGSNDTEHERPASTEQCEPSAANTNDKADTKESTDAIRCKQVREASELKLLESNRVSLNSPSIDSKTTSDTERSNSETEEYSSIKQGRPIEKTAKTNQNLLNLSADRGDSKQVAVVMRSQLNNQRAWIPKMAQTQKVEEFVLLGDIPVGKWDDGDDEVVGENVSNDKETIDVRSKISKYIQSEEQDRKRKMFLDRHDALLDQGKVC